VKAFTGVLVGLTLLLVPSTALGQTELPVGEAHGVRVVRPHGTIVVIFSAKLHKRYAGKNLEVSCTTLLEDGANIGSQVLTVPRHSRKLDTGELTHPIDFCRVWRPRHRHSSKRVLASVPLTQKGAVFVDEESKTLHMLSWLGLAYFVEEKQKLDGNPTYDELVQGLPKRARPYLSQRIVPLAAPGDTPPRHRVGYYSDGDEHVAVAIVSASGRRLFVEYGPDGVFSTNVLGYMFNERD
jgi:hypothetical protein